MDKNYDDYIKKSFINKRILVVGAGGIGCEIIKSLNEIPLDELAIIDMDLIEITNLNR